MKKAILLTSAALLLAACGDSTSSSGDDLGSKMISASAVHIDETNKTIDMTLPMCKYIGGEAVFSETASGPMPYTISNGTLNIEDEFVAKGSNQSIIGTWEPDLGNSSLAEMGFKTYLDIGPNNFDMLINADEVCMAEIIVASKPEDDDMIIKSKSCNKIVVASQSMPALEMTVTSKFEFPNISVSMSMLSYSCDMTMSFGQATKNNCTVENLRNGNFDESGMFFVSQSTSKDCEMFGFGEEAAFAKKAARKLSQKIRSFPRS